MLETAKKTRCHSSVLYASWRLHLLKKHCSAARLAKQQQEQQQVPGIMAFGRDAGTDQEDCRPSSSEEGTYVRHGIRSPGT